MVTPRRRRFRALAALLILAGVLVALPAPRGALLRSAGEALVAEDAVTSADVIVVAVGADGAGVLEAADLVQAGVAPRVAVFADPPDPVVDREFLRRGVPYEDAAARSERQLRALGVTAIEQIPRGGAGTEDEASVLPLWCDEHGVGSVVVVSTADHSRRLRRLLRRSMAGHATRVMVRRARHSPFDPGCWWASREGLRTGIVELQKLSLDIMRHPLS